ncbi:acyl-CoA dehydrogenase [Actinomadura sp. LD22]|uniref:Acyl-CoA dehydrogenase n=1 Tax=Actinomadura physcomitrii TaxID=2650748 RepID=A0A6I4MJ86_9ACTN|nr:acyl-CoA dehydrogenase [Actinomadura physcomitrii]MWA04273.1 acyl-CoA dehydrogenase [Actinomadura physcomitrii]MWA05892.1 acyl-CoA dehydrogenase [Actinomadura physcomitrii]
MAIAISEEHRELARTARAFLRDHDARAANRALLEAGEETLPAFWKEFAGLGLLGLHLPEEHGGGGYGLPELVVVAEELGRAAAPGPLVPTMAASAVIAARGGDELCGRLLPGLASGETPAALGLDGSVTVRDGLASGEAVVLGGGLAALLLLVAGDDVAIVAADAAGVTVEVPANLDPSRRAARVRLDGAPAEVIAGAAAHATAIARTLYSAEAVGGALECVESATEYAKVRQQFGRTIGTFQAVKHHCANMLVAAELGTAAVWDAARAASGPSDQFELAAAVAAALAVPAFLDDSGLNIQVHGGIGFTWEHDAHLLMRRAAAIEAVVDPEAAARDVTRLLAAGVVRATTLDLPPEAEARRAEVRELAREIAALPKEEQRVRLIETGYVQPHWPKPWGLEAPAGLQLVIEEEFKAAGVKRPQYGITSWNILTIIQHGSPEQVERWVRPALLGEEIWCQLFSEPEAGSDAASVKTRAVKTDGGWIVNGQKVWTSGAHYCRWGFATVRTDPDAPKHAGVTMMVIDMEHPGVEVRPLRQITGDSEFNEVFFSDVFVPDSDVVGTPNQGWTVARATLGNERVSIGGGVGGAYPMPDLVKLCTEHPDRVPGGAERVGAHEAEGQALRLLNLRSAERAVAGGEPGPEGNITKLVLAEHGHAAADLLSAFAGPELVFSEGLGAFAGRMRLGSRGMSIAGGTSEITRNQIAERILRLPRDPLIK